MSERATKRRSDGATKGMRPALLWAMLCLAGATLAQEQIDKGDAEGKAQVDLAKMTMRVRITKLTPAQEVTEILWRRGGEGLGGTVTKGQFPGPDGTLSVPVNQWSKPMPVEQVAGKGGGVKFVTIVTSATVAKKTIPLTDVAVEFEFAESGKVLKTFTETSPKGATAGIAIPANAKTRADFVADLSGLYEHARNRHDRLAKLFPQPAKMPQHFSIFGNLGGYGEGAGYGIRHCNPEIVKIECETLKLLGVNSLVGGIKLADAAGAGQDFRHAYWGGPGSGSPMAIVKKRGGTDADDCPYDPAIAPGMAASVAKAIEEQKRIGAKEQWGLWWDEIGVAAKEHTETCPRCGEKFIEYLKAQKVEPKDIGAADWSQVKPFIIWGKGGKVGQKPQPGTDGLRYYYTFRFMTESTAQLFVESAKTMKEAGVFLYAMHGPTPSWAGHSLDWPEFYDRGANTAYVFETSNRDPRTWQFESYLADIGRGICDRHNMPFGCLVKPHRGAVAQRMLSVVARGAKHIEWYTYGPDYSKGDSFSQSPELLERVAKAARFLGANEEYLYEAKPAVKAQVAFCSPRSSEIWGKATELGVTAFEDAKWVYIALRHAGVNLDVISEQQLAEGKLEQYKTIYVVGPNLRRDAGASLHKWVEAGGRLWTDAIGLSRDESNQPAHDWIAGVKERKLQTWGTVEGYRATELKPYVEKDVPAGATISRQTGPFAVSVGRELFDPALSAPGFSIAEKFSDGSPASLIREVGKGQVHLNAFWVGLSYSAKVRNPSYDMSADYPAVNIAAACKGVTFPVVVRSAKDSAPIPNVEAVVLQKDGKRSVALMNWAYHRTAKEPAQLMPAQQIAIDLSGLGDIKKVRSHVHGDLPMTPSQSAISVTLPKLEEIDLLLLD